ncbi:zinc knuckle CX2CX4HX4C [Artemisia annua]|uniref:Zinc knuckle CX2CX4HX4C n=1 Tax=Artemisia annua TaxID=35608 RepID=A0A2U1KTF9_ARTAN|nr:zinc knuckle CX2CX4HX4C [Artemisia annua]
MVSSIGVPIIMDRMTTSICEKPYGRASFARVLVEIDSSKALADNIELWYESLGKILRLRVEYTWVPPRCVECKVYGHYTSECAKKVNTVSKVNKDGDNLKTADKGKGINDSVVNNGDDGEGWQTATNRRSNRGMGYNTRYGQSGGYNGRGGVSNYRNDVNNMGNHNVGNAGTRDANKKVEPVNRGSVGNVDKSVVANDNGEPVNKGKNKVNEGSGSNDGNRGNGNVDPKKNGANKNTSNRNGKASNTGNKTGQGSKGGDGVSTKESVTVKEVSTSNRFDLLMEEGANRETDLWNEVKKQVATACNSGIPIVDNVLKGWTTDMVRFYTVKWNNRIMNNVSPQQHLEFKVKNLSNQIVQLNRNLNKNAILIADQRLKSSVLTNQDQSDLFFNRFYDEAYRAELAKVEVLQNEKDLTEVDMFLLLNIPLDEDLENETSGSAQFMASNEATNDIDILMALTGGGLASQLSNFQ